jgi:hypothetical protein
MRLTEAVEASRLGELVPSWFAALLRRPAPALQP